MHDIICQMTWDYIMVLLLKKHVIFGEQYKQTGMIHYRALASPLPAKAGVCEALGQVCCREA